MQDEGALKLRMKASRKIIVLAQAAGLGGFYAHSCLHSPEDSHCTSIKQLLPFQSTFQISPHISDGEATISSNHPLYSLWSPDHL